jgi:hypothetical protein
MIKNSIVNIFEMASIVFSFVLEPRFHVQYTILHGRRTQLI